MLGAPELAEDERFRTNALRVANRSVLTVLLSGFTSALRRDDLLAGLEAAGVPAGPINTVAQVFADPQVEARRMRIRLPATGAAGGTADYVRLPIRFSDADVVQSTGAPRLGEHSTEILGSISNE